MDYGDSRAMIFKITIFLILTLAVSATFTEKLLRVSLFEVGASCLNPVSKLNSWFLELMSTPMASYSWKTYMVLAVLPIILYYLFHILFMPLNRIRILGDIGYITEGKFTKKEIANSVRKRRMVGDIPPVYPNGWFGLTESHTLKIGESKNIALLGLNLAVFRGEDGKVNILDAYCPHMGANLAIGGKVIGNCIECPFHGWQFRGSDGKCTKIPYTDKIPDVAKVKKYTSCEKNGWIYLWFNAEGEEPTWQIPDIDQINNKTWKYGGRTEHFVNSHIEEVPENGADVQHLLNVHTPLLTSGVDLRYMWNKFWSFGCHEWKAQWEANPEPEGHIGTLRLTHNMNILGLSLVNMNVVARQIGPGIVYLTFETMFGRGVYIQSLTPSEPMVQKMVHNIYVDRYMPMVIAKFFLLGEALQVERDIMIWNNKKYQGKPLFVKSKEDSLISRHRRWYSQFYSKNSPRLNFQDDSLDW